MDNLHINKDQYHSDKIKCGILPFQKKVSNIPAYPMFLYILECHQGELLPELESWEVVGAVGDFNLLEYL